MNAIYTSYHQHRLAALELRQIQKEKDPLQAAALSKKSFSYLYPRSEYYKNQYRAHLSISLHTLFSKEPAPKATLGFYQQAQAYKRTWASIFIQRAWRNKQHAKVSSPHFK